MAPSRGLVAVCLALTLASTCCAANKDATAAARAARVHQSLLQPWPRSSGQGTAVPDTTTAGHRTQKAHTTANPLLGPVTKSNGVLSVELNGVAPPGQPYPWCVSATSARVSSAVPQTRTARASFSPTQWHRLAPTGASHVQHHVGSCAGAGDRTSDSRRGALSDGRAVIRRRRLQPDPVRGVCR